ncbi:MAG TPA: copper resistance CopC family protein [Steroidobacteraceae bacterium]|nr:copper resistance CopC family protein [Steroidobacteraceae bacterium]
MRKARLVAVVAAMVVIGPAFGHARLLGTSPPADAQLQAAPKSLTLNFNENARLAILTLTVGGMVIPVAVDRSAPAAREITVSLPVLAVGTYQVQWSALSPADGHITKGTFSFSIVGPPR